MESAVPSRISLLFVSRRSLVSQGTFVRHIGGPLGQFGFTCNEGGRLFSQASLGEGQGRYNNNGSQYGVEFHYIALSTGRI